MSVKRLPHFVPRPRSDFIIQENTIDQPELLRDFNIRKDVDNTLHQYILDIIRNNWFSFYERGVSRPILDF